MRRRLALELSPTQIQPVEGMRAPSRGDVEALSQLMLDAYRGTIDDGGESIDDARAEVRRLFEGAYGEMDWSCSTVVERHGCVVAATLITRYENAPFVAFSMTAPSCKRQGLARAGLEAAIDRLQQRGETRLLLAVTAGNVAAEALYESLGFRDEPRDS